MIANARSTSPRSTALPQPRRPGGPVSARLPPEGRRLHLQHGPIDLVIEAWGEAGEVEQGYRQAEQRFADILEVLVRELPLLKSPIPSPSRGGAERSEAEGATPAARRARNRRARFCGKHFALRPFGAPPPLEEELKGPVARRMFAAVWPYRDVFITPMAAVAGAVADEMLAAMVDGLRLEKAYVNDGGDIAFHLTPGARLRAGIVACLDHPSLDGFADLRSDSPVRGLATSGWRGRSFSLGIADSVTVLARNAAAADAAATIIGNAVNVDHAAIARAPAISIRDDTDLGDLLVTVAVGPLPDAAVARALAAGVALAEVLQGRGLIEAAALCLQGECRVTGPSALLPETGKR